MVKLEDESDGLAAQRGAARISHGARGLAEQSQFNR